MIILFGVIAFVYSLGGFAGGSSYVLALASAGTPVSQIPAISLFCNIFVSAIVFLNFASAGHFRLNLAAPFLIGSIPAAYAASQLSLPKEIFIAVLGISLAMASLRILFSRTALAGSPPGPIRLYSIGVPAGALMGFFSGLIGIGGGIFLWPVLLLLKWADVKQASAAASFFILANSLCGLAGQLQKGVAVPEFAVGLAVAAVIGGAIGSTLGARHLTPVRLQRVFASLMTLMCLQFLAKLL